MLEGSAIRFAHREENDRSDGGDGGGGADCKQNVKRKEGLFGEGPIKNQSGGKQQSACEGKAQEDRQAAKSVSASASTCFGFLCHDYRLS